MGSFQGSSQCPFGCPPIPGQGLVVAGAPPGFCSLETALSRLLADPILQLPLASLLSALLPPWGQCQPWLQWPFCPWSSHHLPGFLSVSLQLLWVRGHWPLTGWRPQVRDLPQDSCHGVPRGPPSWVLRAAGAEGALDSPGRGRTEGRGALTSPTPSRPARRHARSSNLAAHLWPPGLGLLFSLVSK